jgi:NAD(P)-dependent dehydrogenase (short-subunit alcohol dehydrogenase family)
MMDRSPVVATGHSLSGRVCIVTGSAQGLGLSVAEHLCAAGASVIIADKQLEKACEAAARLVAAGHTAAAVPVDITLFESAQTMVTRAIELYGHIDVLVNNAGLDSPTGLAWELGPGHWKQVIDVDLTGQWWCTMAVLPHMISRRSGRIIFISSVSARTASPPGAPEETESLAYNTAKSGLIGLTIGLSAQVEASGILVNAIAPGPTGTGRPVSAEFWETYRARYPLGPGGPEPVALACLHLIGPGGDWISGAVLNVSGGRWRGY